MEEDIARGTEREQKLQAQRDGLQSREEIMDLQVSRDVKPVIRSNTPEKLILCSASSQPLSEE